MNGGQRALKRGLTFAAVATAIVVLGVVSYFNYDLRAGLAAAQGDTPEHRVATFLNAVIAGDEPSALTEWQVAPAGSQPKTEALLQRRMEVTRSPGSKFDMQVEGGWTTGRMVERYCKARPFEERRKAPSPFTASRAARAEKGPSEKRPSQQRSGLYGKRIA